MEKQNFSQYLPVTFFYEQYYALVWEVHLQLQDIKIVSFRGRVTKGEKKEYARNSYWEQTIWVCWVT